VRMVTMMKPELKSNAKGLMTIGVLLLLAACSGDVSGELYVTMKSGDVKRGADVQVIVVGERLMAEWRKGREMLRSEYREARVAAESARARSLNLDKSLHDPSDVGVRDYMLADERASEAERRVAEVKRRYMDMTKLVDGATAKARTDVNGHYEMKGIPPGKYYVIATHKVFDNELSWLVPVEVHGGAQKVDLSNSNSISGPWLEPLE